MKHSDPWMKWLQFLWEIWQRQLKICLQRVKNKLYLQLGIQFQYHNFFLTMMMMFLAVYLLRIVIFFYFIDIKIGFNQVFKSIKIKVQAMDKKLQRYGKYLRKSHGILILSLIFLNAKLLTSSDNVHLCIIMV